MRLRELSAALALAVLLPAVAQALTLDAFELRLVVFDQDGRGYQSVDGPAEGPGSEAALVVEPMFRAVLGAGPVWKHEVVFLVDVVSAASPDAIDAVSSASAVNESGALEVTSTWAPPGSRHSLSLRGGLHVEEPLRSGSLGAAWGLRLYEDNTRLEVSLLGSFDHFNAYRFTPSPRAYATRGAMNANVSLRQVLSPTTVMDVGYGLTLQRGALETSYNSVPLEGDGEGRDDEILPARRHRHAAVLRLAQHVPATRTTLKGLYRHYLDDFGLRAHTAELQGYQFLAPWLYVRAGYRLHEQNGVDFYGERFDAMPRAAQTADSDLGPFRAHELDLKLAFLGARAPFRWLSRSLLDAGVSRYWRSNGLRVTSVSISVGERF